MKTFKNFKMNVKRGWNKNGQLILAVTAGVSAITAVVLAFKGGEKVMDVKAEYDVKMCKATEDLQNGYITQEDFEKTRKDATIEKVKGFTVCYGPAIAFVTVSIVSTAFGYKISIGKQAAALAALKIAESKRGELEAKAKEIVGEKKFEEIKKGILTDKVNSKELPNDIHAPEYEKDGDGNFIAKQYMLPFMLDYDGSFFMGTRNMVDRAMAKAAVKCKREMSLCYNDVKEALKDEGCVGTGLDKHTNGDNVGWIPEDLDSQAVLEYDITPIMHEAIETPVQVIEFARDPSQYAWD